MLPQRFDVAVVGAGPAGSACAFALARSGHSLALIDRRNFPRPKLCGEYLNAGAVRELHDLGIADTIRPAAALLRGMRLQARGELAEFGFSAEAWSLPRTVLDSYVRAQAIAAGACAVRGAVNGLENERGCVRLQLESESGPQCIEARYVVGADGMHSTVAKLSGLDGSSRGSRFAVGAHYAAGGFRNWIEMYASPEGYAAMNPLDDSSANVMFVMDSAALKAARGDVDAELERFCMEITGGRHALGAEQMRTKRSALGPLAARAAIPARGRVLLIGDAAAFVDPFTGQGIFLALAGARLAAAALEEALSSERSGGRILALYSRELVRRVRERERVGRLVRAVLSSGWLSARAARALRARPFDFGPLVDAVCGIAQARPRHLAAAAMKALR